MNNNYRRHSTISRAGTLFLLPFFLVFMVVLATWAGDVLAAENGNSSGNLGRFLPKVEPSALIPGATAFGELSGTPPTAPILKGSETVGYAFLNADFVGSVGYSGKPINVVVGIDKDGVIRGAKLVKHHEPIVLIGIPEKRMTGFIDGYSGLDMVERMKPGVDDKTPADIISGATVTVLVIHDSITRSAFKVIRALELGGVKKGLEKPEAPPRKVDMAQMEVKSWKDLLGDGSIRRLGLTVGDINKAFIEAGPQEAVNRPEQGKADEVYIDMYAALVSVPTIGRSLLGDSEYKLLKERLKPGRQALLFFANGRYSFKGSGYVRGGIFDRIHVVQGEESIRFRDRNHKRIGEIEAEGAPKFKEIALFVIPKSGKLIPAKDWRLELLVARAIGPVRKSFISFNLPYSLPKHYLEPATGLGDASAGEETATAPLWQRIWQGRIVDVVILVLAIGFLSTIFFFQSFFAAHPVWLKRIRVGFLLFTVFWIGGYAGAQLSVVNILTFFNSLMSGFSWEYFLMDPLLFILWCSVAASLLFWGRGAYCGWLCPFGAMQELLNKVAKHFKVPQFEVPWGLHERLWPIKYMIFLPLFALSLYSFTLAEAFAEVEPFKTAVVLRFAREWPWVLYALTLLAAGLFVERFFCRYICPLGACLAIPGRIRMFEWLKRHKECGSPCHRCAQECMVQAIHPDGQINPNECVYCLHCQEVYCDDQLCPPMIQKRLRRERRMALGGRSVSNPDAAREGG